MFEVAVWTYACGGVGEVVDLTLWIFAVVDV